MTADISFDRLRAQACSALFAPTSLADAVQRMGFVQADPIRAPARAQDLILRHRVRGYHAGDLERRFGRLRLEEDFLHAYGFMPGDTRRLLHPRLEVAGGTGAHVPAGLAAEVLSFVRAHGPTHPRDLEERFGRERTVNAWGGFSKATTRALDSLRHYGLLRVAGRRDGVRIYEAATPPLPFPADVAERARHLVLLVARILAPVSATSLRGALALMARQNPGLGPLAPVVAGALRTGELEGSEAGGERYLWPVVEGGRRRRPALGVRFLAPFDPVVWDRRRFEHLWGWAYRFEAYTPPAARRFGYYAMPVLWGDAVIGWANVAMAGGRMDANIGYAGRCPQSVVFRRALDAELARMERFLAARAAARLTDQAPGGHVVGLGNTAESEPAPVDTATSASEDDAG